MIRYYKERVVWISLIRLVAFVGVFCVFMFLFECVCVIGKWNGSEGGVHSIFERGRRGDEMRRRMFVCVDRKIGKKAENEYMLVLGENRLYLLLVEKGEIYKF